MGWSCGMGAAYAADAWRELCIAQSGSQNSYYGKDGADYFFETSRREHDDGAITGTTWRVLPTGFVRKAGSFRIEGNGDIARFPTAWPFDRTIAFPCPQCGALTHKGEANCSDCGHWLMM